ncbi:MAG: homoserine dehydrogenase [Chloroflexota bacterium]|nr:homoserine dehydrogenase [Chloroflexota bacterium]MDE2884025.1 homoserine dehydrogenase [Chloroflexota bacterium]
MGARETVGVALLGAGTVGAGVAQTLAAKADALSRYAGRRLQLAGVLVRDTGKPRPALPPGVLLTSDPAALPVADNVDIVVEVMGGEQPALGCIESALRSGKHVVTANKQVMALHGPELLALAAEHGVTLAFEASVGGGIPIIGPLVRDLAGNRITGVNAVINGTTNYMLTRMAKEGASYEDALLEAQRNGYAEPDPSDDVDGRDAAYKLAILSTLAFRCTVREPDVYREGIRQLDVADFVYARDLGYVIKLLAASRLHDGAVQARVHPAFLHEQHPLAKVDGVYNAVELEGDLVGWAMFQGPGAGASPTTSAIIGDVLAIVRASASGGATPPYPDVRERVPILPVAELETKYYLRLRAYDKPGVMAQITGVLGEMGVSLASIIQKEVPEDAGTPAEVVIITHKARESAVQEAVRQLEALSVVYGALKLVRIEDGSA